MSLADARKLRFGPYSPPRVAVGHEIQCEMRGLLTMHSWSDRGEIMWPLGIRSGISPGRPSMVLTGDLVSAVRREAAAAVAKHWGTTWRTVRVWRRALGVDRMTEGSTEVARENGNMDIVEFAADGNAASLVPDARTRRDAAHSAAMKGRAPKGPMLAYRLRIAQLVAEIVEDARKKRIRRAPESREQRQASIFEAYFVAGKPENLIAEQFSLTTAAVNMAVSKAIRGLPPDLAAKVSRLRKRIQRRNKQATWRAKDPGSIPRVGNALPRPTLCPRCNQIQPSQRDAERHCRRRYRPRNPRADV